METYIKAVAPSATNRSTATLMKTGQTTSYQTGDDGDIEAGRNVSFTVLAENNVFGNTNRFTDELGGQTYTKNIVIDWSTYNGSTVLGWRRTASTAPWASAVSGALAVSIAPFTTDWRLPNVMEYLSIFNWQLTARLNYSPFNLASNQYHTSNTDMATTTNNIYVWTGNSSPVLSAAKSTNNSYLVCRTFTVTGTTLS
jgi:hypothetical protein